MHAYAGGALMLAFGFSKILYAMYAWWRDIIREATVEAHAHKNTNLHTHLQHIYTHTHTRTQTHTRIHT